MNQSVTLLVWADNSPAALPRLTMMFARRKINVESLTVSATEKDGISRFTIVITTELRIAATIGRQIERMIEAHRVCVFPERDLVRREVALIRALVDPRAARVILARHGESRILDRGERGCLVQCTGTEAEISALFSDLQPHGVTEFVRSGRVAVIRQGEYARDRTRSLHDLHFEAFDETEL